MLRIVAIDGPDRGECFRAKTFHSVRLHGYDYHIHTAAVGVRIGRWFFRVFADVASVHRNSRDAALCEAIRLGAWEVELIEGESPPTEFYSQALRYKTSADWISCDGILKVAVLVSEQKQGASDGC